VLGSALGLCLVLGLLAAPAGAGPAASFPNFSGQEFKALYFASLPLPGTQRITSRPPIYGHAAADQRIQQLAEARGYRLQVTPTVPLGSYGGATLAADAGRGWLALLDAARRNGTPLQANSGYRSVATQREIFTRQLGGWSTAQIASGAADRAIDAVLAFHSIPGYSRHHTGKTLDLSHAGGSNSSFSSSAAYRWISADNYRVAKSYGFIPSYPPNAGAQGPNPEPWEFVYLGVDRIRCAVEVVRLADPDAFRICGVADVPIVGKLNGDGAEDVFAYRPGTRRETLLAGTTDRTIAARSAPQVTGLYVPISGDFRGDGIDDILWYAPGPAQDHLWTFSAGGVPTSRARTVNGRYLPVAGDFDGDGDDDIFWYAPGTATDSMWVSRPDGTYAARPREVKGHYLPVAGDFDGDGIDDILWYAPGTAPDFLWLHNADRTHRDKAMSIDGRYQPVAGDFDGDGVDDLFWYAAGAATDFVWYQNGDAGHASRSSVVAGSYTTGAGDHDLDGIDDIVFLAPDGGQDSIWFGTAGRGFTKAARSL
jgi:LAS superfamily LD-carboxypeptidase LdcB